MKELKTNPKKLSVTEAIRNFSEIVGQIRFKKEAFILTKGGKPVAELRPVTNAPTVRLGELSDILSSLPHLDKKEVDSFSRDLEKSRKMINKLPPKDPWES